MKNAKGNNIFQRRCHVDHKPEQYRAAAQRSQLRFLQKSDPQLRIEDHPPVVVFVRYVCFYVKDEERVSIERINDNHQVLRRAFLGQDPGHVFVKELQDNSPTQYPFYDILGSPNIDFFPKTITQIEYVKLPTYLGEVPIQDVIDMGAPMKEVINIYIGSNGKESTILGQAMFPYNSVYVNFGSVGGPNFPGTAGPYAGGKSLVHEMGHCFGLLHVFSVKAGECDDIKHHSDIPEAFTPNYEAYFAKDEQGRIVHMNDHRYRESVLGLPDRNSCARSSVFDGRCEMAMNYLDYGPDDTLVAFSRDQCDDMRENLSQVFHLKVYSPEEAAAVVAVSASATSPNPEITEGTTTTTTNVPASHPNSNSNPVQVDGANEVPNSSSFVNASSFGVPNGADSTSSETQGGSLWVVVAAILASVVLLCLFLFTVWSSMKTPSSPSKWNVGNA